MKRFGIFLLALLLTATLAACKAHPLLEGSLEDILADIYARQPLGMDSQPVAIDLTDTTANGLYAVKTFSGLDSGKALSAMVTSAPENASAPYTLTLVRVKNRSDAKSVGQQMKDGIDPARWGGVQADEVVVCGYGDVVMLAMTGPGLQVSAQALADAFQAHCGGKLDFTIK